MDYNLSSVSLSSFVADSSLRALPVEGVLDVGHKRVSKGPGLRMSSLKPH